MTIEKIAAWVTPLLIVAVLGLVAIGYGLANPRESAVYDYVFGIPVLVASVGGHFLVRRLLNGNTARVWLVEAAIVALLAYVVFRR